MSQSQMISAKLHKTETADGILIWPKYRLFKECLVIKKFSDVKDVHTSNQTIKELVRDSMAKDGLLNPPVIDKNNVVVNGCNRLAILKKYGDATFFYQATNYEEKLFFSRLNKTIWDMYPEEPQDFGFCFKGRMKNLSEQCYHLFIQNVKSVNPKKQL